MNIIMFLSMLLWLLLIPFLVGAPIAKRIQKNFGICHGSGSGIAISLVMGTLAMYAIFQIEYVFFVLFYNHFSVLVTTFAATMIIISLFFLIIEREYLFSLGKNLAWKQDWTTPFWIIVIGLVGYQVWKAVSYQFIDHDDSYYAVVSVIADEMDNMYRFLPFTGDTTDLDVRHAFSGIPIYVSFLTRAIGLHPTIIHHTVFPVILIVLSYCMIGLIGSILCNKKREYLPIFLLFYCLLQLFGNESIYTTSTFFLTRTAQGKAVLGSFIIPVAIFTLLLLAESCEKQKKNRMVLWITFSLLVIVAGFSTMMALVLIPLLVGIGVLLLGIIYKKTILWVQWFLTLLPAVGLAIVYVLNVKW